MTIDYYDRGNRPLTMDQYARLLENRDYKRVASQFVGTYWISTVWLGLDHSFYGGPPLIFETMVFANTPDDLSELGDDVWCDRYTTEHQAVLGHYAAVVEVQACVDQGVAYDGYHQYDNP